MARKRALAVPLALLVLTGLSDPARADEAASAEPDAKAVLATLPFEKNAPRNRIVIDLAPEGNARPMPFQLDTGATTSFVSPVLARSMGVKVSRTRADPYRRKTLLGPDVLFYVDTRRSDTGSSSGLEFGLLGGDFLSDYVLELDFAKRQVRFIDPKQYQVPGKTLAKDEAVLPLMLVSNRPGLRVKVNGHAVDLLVDTGADMGLMLSGAKARSGEVAFENGEPRGLIGAGGSTSCFAAEVARLEIGPFAFEQQQAMVAPSGFYNLGFAGDSILGFDLLDEFLVRIDYPHKRLWLRRNEAVAQHDDELAEGDAAEP